MKNRIILLFTIFLSSTFSLNSQIQLSVYSQVSIITVGSGDNLYEAFGHSAIRIKDPVLNFDLIYNYGVFDFNAPNFYANFTKGKLLYKLVRYDFDIFLRGYQQEERWMKEQVLNLTELEKTTFFLYLEENAQPENATYLYDPFFNNCASKLIDVSKDVLKNKIVIKTDGISNKHTLRTLMNERIHWNTWGNFGINLALGNKLDAAREPIAYTYLPDYVHSVFTKSELNSSDVKPIVLKENLLLEFTPKQVKGNFFGPFLFFLILSIFIIYKTYKDYQNQKISHYLDFSLLSITGIIGVLLVFLWFFTNHSTTQNNFNILWAFMPNLIVLLVYKKAKFMHIYYSILVLLLLGLVILWILKIQLFSVVLIPFLIALFTRYLYVSTAFKKSIPS